MGKIAQMMGGLPMNELIGAPLTSVVDAQRDLAKTMIGYVNEIGYADGEGKDKEARMLDFKLTKPVISDEGVTTTNIEMQAPVLGLLPMPALLVDKVSIDFQMEVTAAESSKSNTSAEASTEVSGGFWRVKAKVSGKVSTSRENTRSTNQTAKYQVHVEANQQPQTECMSKLMDMFAQCTEPVDIRSSGEKSAAAA
ncbi:MAG: DUF2589 domain-containing protein [Treponema sp.]|uniref:DUF2589 domain-containing protein n=1 Tax=Treponema sp. TaxID=166 RepID=UPI0025DDD189|nr:DUF2589 domain-containing protein [Treponema sp.]MBQ9624065.1 DUF2589 domain-containing protein [Treponema sp.]MBR0099967.1 DUF2589 domain-containing protein [Treponema sp.]MBR0494889.1 DUF2589 domain-containing protein [Treponema sp.]